MKINFHHWVQIGSTRHLIAFVGTIMLLSAVFVNGISYMLLSAEDFWANRLVANLEVVVLSMSIAYFVATQIRKIVGLKAELEFALNHDPLTGAGTRSHMNSFLTQGAFLPCPVIITDIDHFKRVNDGFGHQAGDAVLSQFATLLEQHSRESDLVVRIGGEEFLIILPFTKPDEVTQIAEQMCVAIANHPFSIMDRDIAVTASFGVGNIYSVDAVDGDIHRADEALYLAKKGGRNRVCYAGDVAAEVS